MRRRRKAPHKNTVRLARLLENGICILSMEGFEIFKGMPAFEKRIKTSTAPPRFIITHYPLASLYGTPGFKEAFIHCDRVGDFIFEAKYQNGSGSVDEKCPYLWECFSASTVPNWIVWFDGNWFEKNPRGIAAVQWLKTRAANHPIDGRALHVVSSNEAFVTLVKRLFKGPPA